MAAEIIRLERNGSSYTMDVQHIRDDYLEKSTSWHWQMGRYNHVTCIACRVPWSCEDVYQLSVILVLPSYFRQLPPALCNVCQSRTTSTFPATSSFISLIISPSHHVCTSLDRLEASRDRSFASARYFSPVPCQSNLHMIGVATYLTCLFASAVTLRAAAGGTAGACATWSCTKIVSLCD